MLGEDTAYLFEYKKDIFKMTKAKAAMFLVTIVAAFALIFSITDAYPTTESSSESVESGETTAENQTHLTNNSRLVITNVVKTIEFEVGVLDDDSDSGENATVASENSTAAANATDFYETDIQVLNLDLLKEVVDKASEMLNATDAP